jgi:hypothetical protein
MLQVKAAFDMGALSTNIHFTNGTQDEAISSHIHRRQMSGQATWFDNLVCWFLKKIEIKHCLKSLGE